MLHETYFHLPNLGTIGLYNKKYVSLYVKSFFREFVSISNTLQPLSEGLHRGYLVDAIPVLLSLSLLKGIDSTQKLFLTNKEGHLHCIEVALFISIA